MKIEDRAPDEVLEKKRRRYEEKLQTSEDKKKKRKVKIETMEMCGGEKKRKK